MIESIHLNNFESHKNTKLYFSNGINVISGPSNNGKSSIIRGIYWVKDNKPSGGSMVSFWARESKNKTSFSEIVSNGNTIRREKGKFNGYILGDKEMEAIGQGVPTEIIETLNLSEVNVQYQFDRPFLLDDSPQDVAKLFNRTIRLDIIDRVQSKAESYRKKLNQEIELRKENNKKLTSDIEKFDWIPSIEKKVITLSKLEALIESDKKELDSLQKLYSDYISYKDSIKKYTIIASYKKLTDSIDQKTILIDTTNRERVALMILSESYKKLIEDTKKYSKLNDFRFILEKIDSLLLIINKKDSTLKEVADLLANYKRASKQVEESGIEIENLTAMLPSICPTCGQRIENGKVYSDRRLASS